MRWKLLHPRDWSPSWYEHILYRPPGGGAIVNGRILFLDPIPGHHLISVSGYHFRADHRDIFPVPGWREEQATRERERVEEEELFSR
jgi:hypothetical protein